MPLFTLHRDHILRTTKGHTIRFEAGEPSWIPPAVVPDAVAIGAIPVGERVDVLEEEKTEATPLTSQQREEELMAAIKQLASRNGRGDFTASGLPNSRRLQVLTGFEIINKERDAAWMLYQQQRVA